MTKYLSIGAGVFVVLLLIYCLLLKNDRDNALSKIDRLNGQLNTAIKANIALKGDVDLLNKQLALNDAYIDGLEQRKRNTEQVITPIKNQFKQAKHENPSINDWAGQPLPSGLL